MAAAWDSATPVTADQTTVNITTDHVGDEAADASSGTIIDKVQEELKRAADKVEAEFSKNEAKMHRYPPSFRGLMSKDDRYFVPRCVAIGPYHHRAAAYLHQAEEMKRAAAYYFICERQSSGHSAEVIYARILSVAGDARSCYDDDAVLAGIIPQADFATMMFQDACFLLQYIMHANGVASQLPESLRRWFVANEDSIQRDIFLLENQVPWLVLDTLIYKPAHLLDLLRHCQSGSSSKRRRISWGLPAESLPEYSSAIDLAEMGIQLKTNRTAKFRDTRLARGFLFSNLFLAPLVMDDLNACWLVNMLAFEIAAGTRYTNTSYVTSYVLLIAMLMDREEDVHELRVKRILHGDFSDQRTLSFLKDLLDLFDYWTEEHSDFMADLQDYRRKRWMWISLHKFIYNNLKSIVTVFSIISVLVGIFKTLFSISMKQH
ncbi:hypothetical protein SORBI_3008G170900 [Sorghum bicolor]|uniref:Uncharacterized protein n=1 Tax=Sorghum bicolor TaxID=4558 RepID=A0A1Z5R776_SORBI|nr:hypothetical protein SORBI_3008G170900 [Sorghum bicolor]